MPIVPVRNGNRAGTLHDGSDRRPIGSSAAWRRCRRRASRGSRATRAPSTRAARSASTRALVRRPVARELGGRQIAQADRRALPRCAARSCRPGRSRCRRRAGRTRADRSPSAQDYVTAARSGGCRLRAGPSVGDRCGAQTRRASAATRSPALSTALAMRFVRRDQLLRDEIHQRVVERHHARAPC